MANILVIDDELDMLALIKNILEKNNYNVSVYQSPLDVDVTELKKYNLILLDIMMPSVDGIQFCQQIRNKVDVPIIFLTAKAMEENIVDGLSSGADDYIIKPFKKMELVARIEAHLRREKRDRHVSLNFSNISIDLSSKEVNVKGEKVYFTKSEYQICELLAKRKGQVFSKEQIYEIVFGYEGDSGASVIAEHIKNIRAKFQKYDLSPIITVWGIGYKWEL